MKAIRRRGMPLRPGQADGRLIFEGREHVVAERGQKHALDQLGGQLTAAAVAEQDAGRTTTRAAGRCRACSVEPVPSVGAPSSSDLRSRSAGPIGVRESDPLAIRRLEMAAIGVVGRARPFGRHHGRAQRRLRRALLAERRAVVRLLQPFQDLAADADGRFLVSMSSTSNRRSASWSRYSARSL